MGRAILIIWIVFICFVSGNKLPFSEEDLRNFIEASIATAQVILCVQQSGPEIPFEDKNITQLLMELAKRILCPEK